MQRETAARQQAQAARARRANKQQQANQPPVMDTAIQAAVQAAANGAKIQKAATEKLHIEHDLDRNNLHDFLEALRSRAIACGWFDTLLMVPVNGVPLSIIDNYGTMTRAAVDTHARTYMFQNTRAAQDSHNMFTCLEAS
jgi:hypothetical protein